MSQLIVLLLISTITTTYSMTPVRTIQPPVTSSAKSIRAPQSLSHLGHSRSMRSTPLQRNAYRTSVASLTGSQPQTRHTLLPAPTSYLSGTTPSVSAHSLWSSPSRPFSSSKHMLADQPTPSAAQTFGKGTVEAYLLWKNIADLATDIRALKRQFERDYPEIEELPEPPTINIEGSLTRTKFKQATGWQAKLSRFWQPQAKNNPDNIWQVMLSELKAYEDYIMIVIRKANRIERHKETETIQDARKLLTLVNKVNKQIINIKSTPVLSFNYSQDLEARTWNRISDAERTALEDTRLILEKYKQLYQEIMKSKIQWWDVSWKLPFTADSYIQQIIQDYLTSDKPLADIYDASLDTITKKLSKASEKLAATEDKSNLPQQVKNYKILLDQYIQNVKDLPRLTAPTSNASLDWRDSWIDRLRASRLSDPFSLFASSPQIYVVGSLAYAIYRHYFQ